LALFSITGGVPWYVTLLLDRGKTLRNKANFGVLEGLITVLLNEEVHIDEILESEGNQDTFDDKFNRVDVKAKNSKGEIIIVEIQLTREQNHELHELHEYIIN
jgi:hypothetical protein